MSSTAGTSSLGAELAQLSLKDLRERAAAAGVDDGAIEDARDGEQPKPDIIALIIVAKHDASTCKLEEELQTLSLKDLRERAAAAGVDDGAIEDARDGEQPKPDIIALIVANQAERIHHQQHERSARTLDCGTGTGPVSCTGSDTCHSCRHRFARRNPAGPGYACRAGGVSGSHASA